jgi:hypothetical protein
MELRFREVLALNIDQDIGYPYRCFRGFIQTLQEYYIALKEAVASCCHIFPKSSFITVFVIPRKSSSKSIAK